MTANMYEVNIALGQGQMTVLPPTPSMFPVQCHIDWRSSLSLSPPAAKVMLRQLIMIIEDYEAKFGAIPEDGPAYPASVDNVVILGSDLAQPPGDAEPPAPPEPCPPAA